MHIRGPLLATAAALSLLLAGCAGEDLSAEGDSGGSGESAGGQVTLSSQSFNEAKLVTAMYEAVLEDAGYTVDTKLVESRDVYFAEFPGEVDVVPEYVGGITDYLNTVENGEDAESLTTGDPTETIEAAQPLLEAQGITLLEPSEATSQNAYFVTQEYAEQNDVSTLSDLEGESLVLAAAPDCEGRTDCEAGLEDVYGIDITKVLPLGFGSPQTYKAVLEGEALLGQTGTLDGTLEGQGLVLLEDDQGIQPAQNLVPAVSEEFIADNSDVRELLNELMATLDNETLAPLIVRVSVDREQPEAVAKDFLTEQGLI